jgi:cytochrome c oxidase subunit 2
MGASACACVVVLVSGCGGNGQSTLDPHSSDANNIENLWWGMLAAAGVVFAGTLLLIALSIARRRREGMPVIGSDAPKLNALVVAFGLVIPVVALSVLFFVADIGVVKATDAPTRGQTKMTIRIAGRQWFWEARYPGSRAVVPNEIHIPVRTPVNVVVTSPDVIHSFWVPELNKKVDAIPGHPNNLLLYADKPGRYRGQCAEFCGLQHAKMAMAIYADPPQRFREWLRHEAVPVSASERQNPGFQAFMANDCGNCHTLRGTSARGDIGPDLTHLMTRETLAALTIPNTPKDLADWVHDPQQFKPGNKMPQLGIAPSQFRQLIAFLRSLK